MTWRVFSGSPMRSRTSSKLSPPRVISVNSSGAPLGLSTWMLSTPYVTSWNVSHRSRVAMPNSMPWRPVSPKFQSSS